MLITNKVKIHMDTPHQRLIPVDVMQCDTETRALELELYVASKPWVIPTDVELVAAYFKTNGVKGLYDTLHDGSPACAAAGKWKPVPGQRHIQWHLAAFRPRP